MSISLRELELTAGQCVVEMLDGATLQFTSFPQPFTVPCTITKLVKDFDLIPGGKSQKTMFAICLFRACTIPASALPTFNDNPKGVKCTLSPTPKAASISLQLWHGGIMPGAAVYQFMLVDQNFKA